MSATTTPALEYAPGAPVRRRKRIRRVMMLLVILAIGSAGWRLGPAARDRATLLYWQRQCTNFEFPRDVVLYETDAAKAAALLWRPEPEYVPLPFYGHNQPVVTHAVYQPRCLREFATRTSAATSPGQRSPIFCHERRTPAGQRRLVIVYTRPWSDFGPLWEWELYEPAGVISGPKLISAGTQTGSHRGVGGGWEIPQRVGAGQADPADPADPTRFTIPWILGGRPSGVYEGRLTDDDKVVITRREAVKP
jgi:hypothetical protein